MWSAECAARSAGCGARSGIAGRVGRPLRYLDKHSWADLERDLGYFVDRQAGAPGMLPNRFLVGGVIFTKDLALRFRYVTLDPDDPGHFSYDLVRSLAHSPELLP